MQVLSIVSTKGGVGKTTTAANLGGYSADAGLRVLLLDLDVQPTLSSYFELRSRAPAGIYELLAFNERDASRLVSHTSIAGLDIVLSNDDRGQLNTLLLHAPDGRLRLRNLLSTFRTQYDLLVIDTQGARSVLLEAAVLASDLALSPVTPEILAAREFRRGTLQLMQDIAPYRHLGIKPPLLHLLINRAQSVSSNARLIQQTLREVFQDQVGVRVLETGVPAIEAYPRAATRGLPVHRVEYRQPTRRAAPAALDTMCALAKELFPSWRDRFVQLRSLAAPGAAGCLPHGQRASSCPWRKAYAGADSLRRGRVHGIYRPYSTQRLYARPPRPAGMRRNCRASSWMYRRWLISRRRKWRAN